MITRMILVLLCWYAHQVVLDMYACLLLCAVGRKEVPAQTLGQTGNFIPILAAGSTNPANGVWVAPKHSFHCNTTQSPGDSMDQLVAFCEQWSTMLSRPWSRPGHYLVAQKLEAIGAPAAIHRHTIVLVRGFSQDHQTYTNLNKMPPSFSVG